MKPPPPTAPAASNTLAPARSRVLRGQAASPGTALGEVVLLDDSIDDTRPTPLEHRFASLPEALATAAQQLEAIRDGLDPSDPARGMVDFQIEFLGDPALLESAGNPTSVLPAEEEVWRPIIEAHIADFDTAEDEYFRHRASDLRDIRERVLRVLNRSRVPTIPALGDDAVVVAHDLSPSRFLSAAWKPTQALVLRGGSPHAHIALLARARALPMIVAVGAAPIAAGDRALVDGAAGTLELNPGPERIQALMQAQQRQSLQKALEAEKLFQPATTATGEAVSVMINVASLSELDQVNPACCDGIGLVRTELLFAQGVPAEEEQLGFYRQLLVWAKGRPVVVRTLDAGGDKPVPGLGMPLETNPFLGIRGLRLCLREPEVFRLQLRALLRAAAEGDLRIMLPMLTNAAELIAAREHLEACAQALRQAGIRHRTPPLGVMIEIPALALALESLGPIDFASVGSNDLLQYAMAAARDLPEVASLANPQHPGFQRLMRILAESARTAAIPLSICGDLAGQAEHIPALLRHGLRSLSVPVAAVGSTKLAVAAWPQQMPHG